MATLGFPYPIIGTAYKLIKHAKNQPEDGKGPLLETLLDTFKDNPPPLVLHFSGSEPLIFICGPEAISDVYLKYNKYFDKSVKSKNMFFDLFGNGLLLTESNELWSQKSKHMSAAFYKEKMISMLETITEITFDRLE